MNQYTTVVLKAIASSSETTPHRSRDWRQVKSKIFQGEVYNTQTVSLVVAWSEEKSDCSCRRSHRHIHKRTTSLIHSRFGTFGTILIIGNTWLLQMKTWFARTRQYQFSKILTKGLKIRKETHYFSKPHYISYNWSVLFQIHHFHVSITIAWSLIFLASIDRGYFFFTGKNEKV